MKYYSSTYANEVMKLLGVVALLGGFDLPAETEAIVGALLVLIGAGWTIYTRYRDGKAGKVGEVNVLGLRK